MGILILMLGYLAYDMWFAGDKNAPVRSTTRAVVPAQRQTAGSAGNAALGNTTGQIATAANQWFTDFSHDRWGEDPFEHPGYSTANQTQQSSGQAPLSQVLSSRFHLTAVSKRGGDDYVLINNEVLTVGDVIDGAELTEIRANSVIMDYRGNKIIVPLSRPRPAQNTNSNKR